MTDPTARVLDAMLADAVALATTLGLKIAVPNIVFPPEDDPNAAESVYLEAVNFWAGVNWQSWGKQSGNIGTFQLSVINPFQAGAIEPTQYAGLVLDHYFNGRTLWTAQMERITFSAAPVLLSTVQSGHKSIYPVSIPYRFTKP